MSDQAVTRRLVAIFYADVAGYSRLTGADEEGTHRRVMAVLDDVTARIGDAGGMVLRYAGDAILATFPSVVLAVDTSAAIQTALAEREASVAEDERVTIRIGINVGDVIEDRGEVYGEGVNLAARLEAAADPGGLCISDDAYKQCRKRSVLTFRDGGEQAFKNIDGRVRVYHWTAGAVSEVSPTKAEPLPLPDKPSIAVLPFTNMSADPEQEYFSDGITEDIITELARFNALFVISRNSTFQYKGRSPNVKDVGRELGVLYVVEGSVRRAGDRVRITAQLIEARTGNHIWAERYDRSLDDIFAVQDEVVSGIALMVSGRIDAASRIKSIRKPTSDIGAYDLALRASWLVFNGRSRFEAIELLERAIEIDPEFAIAHAQLAQMTAWGVFHEVLDLDEARTYTRKHGETATRLSPKDGLVHGMLAEAYGMVGEHKLAAHHADVAIALNPNAFHVLAFAGWVKGCQGDYDGGIALLERAMSNDPYSAFALREEMVDVYYLARRYEDCVEQLIGWPGPQLHTELAVAAALAQLDRVNEATATIRKIIKAAPNDWNIVKVCHAFENMCAKPEDGERWLEGFRKAGVDV